MLTSSKSYEERQNYHCCRGKGVFRQACLDVFFKILQAESPCANGTVQNAQHCTVERVMLCKPEADNIVTATEGSQTKSEIT